MEKQHKPTGVSLQEPSPGALYWGRKRKKMLLIENNKKSNLDDYAGMKFVLDSLDKNAKDSIRNNVYFDGACFWGTDGKRAHYYYPKNYNLEVGTYELISKDAKKIVLEKSHQTFPNLSNLPVFHQSPEWELKISTHDKWGKPEYSQPYTKIIRKMNEAITINYSFLSALPDDHYMVYGNMDKYSAVCFANTNKGAVIMPMLVF